MSKKLIGRVLDWLPVLLPVAVIALAIFVWVFQSSIERDVWNRCHPSHQLTLWETMWSSTRIDQCEVGAFLPSVTKPVWTENE